MLPKFKQFFVFLLFLFAACKSENFTSKNYYFPIENFFKEKTYCYTNLNDSTDIMSWRMKAYENNKDTFLTTVVYDGRKRINDSTVEKISNGNSIMLYYNIAQYDENNLKFQMSCSIIDSSVYISRQKKHSVIKWKISFHDIRSSKTAELSRKRILSDVNEERKIFHDYLSFRIPETNEGYDYSAVMTYQEGVGLIAYEMSLPDGSERNYVLTNIK